MKEDVIKVLKVKPHEHPEVYMLKNTLESSTQGQTGAKKGEPFGSPILCFAYSVVLD